MSSKIFYDMKKMSIKMNCFFVIGKQEIINLTIIYVKHFCCNSEKMCYSASAAARYIAITFSGGISAVML
jgi:hypothetical protein